MMLNSCEIILKTLGFPFYHEFIHNRSSSIMGQAELKMTYYRTLRIFGTVYTVIVFVERGVVILAFSEFACG